MFVVMPLGGVIGIFVVIVCLIGIFGYAFKALLDHYSGD